MLDISKLFAFMAKKNASDLFLCSNALPQITVDGVSHFVDKEPLDALKLECFLKDMLGNSKWETFLKKNEINFSHVVPNLGSFRGSLFRQRGLVSCVMRYIPATIPSLADLNLPPSLGDMAMKPRGLVLFVGASGSGKSTSLASIIDFRNSQKTGHILTLEDPIEFFFTNRRSVVSQREIGVDTESLSTGLKSAMSLVPECIFIGEILDMQSMSAALSYAHSGHLVLSTLHSSNTSQALNRIINFFPKEIRQAILSDLASCLHAVVAQRLVSSLNGGRLPVLEILLNTRHVSDLLEQGNISDIQESMEKNLTVGSCTFDQSLLRMFSEGLISQEEAVASSDMPENILWNLENNYDKKSSSEVLDLGAGETRWPAPAPGNNGSDILFSDFLMNV